MMMKISKTILSVLVVSALVGAVYGVRGVKGRAAAEPAAVMMLAPRAIGNAAAHVRAIEFIDYQCPSCAKASYFLHELAKRHPNDIYLEVKYFPLRGHVHSLMTAELAECSRAQGKFWEAHQAMFLSQSKWRDLTDAKPVLAQALVAAGVDMAQVDKCMSDPSVEKTVLAEREAALKLDLKSTPTFYINGQMIVGFKAMEEEMTKLFPDASTILLPADNTAPQALAAAEQHAASGEASAPAAAGSPGPDGR